MRIFSTLRGLLGAAIVAIAAIAATPAMASPGCVGKMWNPITDLDFRLMGGIKIVGFAIMPTPDLGEPPKHQAQTICFCKDGLDTGFGFGLTYWLPSYINDLARQSGCIGFLGGINVLPGFISLTSGQEYGRNDLGKEGSTSMQIHWAYADVAAIAGKSMFEKCGGVTSDLNIAYMTEPDFVFQNDVYSVIMTPQASILAAVPMLSQMTCGMEAIANTLGGWQDWGVCAWEGTRLPYSGSSISESSAQVTNMDVTVKFLSRQSLLGANLRTMGTDATCAPVRSAFYDPFQHRYQWSYPGKVSTRYNQDVLKWGMFIKDAGQGSMISLTSQAAQLGNVDANIPVGGVAGNSGTAAPSGNALGFASQIVASLPKPLNYPSKEAGFMQVWEARECCLKVLTISNVIQMVVENFASMSTLLQQLYQIYNMVNTIYQVIQDPIGAALNFIGNQITSGLGKLADASGLTGTLQGVASGIKNSFGGFTGNSGGGFVSPGAETA